MISENRERAMDTEKQKLILVLRELPRQITKQELISFFECQQQEDEMDTRIPNEQADQFVACCLSNGLITEEPHGSFINSYGLALTFRGEYMPDSLSYGTDGADSENGYFVKKTNN